MADTVDDACIHAVTTIEHNDQQARVEWLCSDCGRVFSWLVDEQAVKPEMVHTWAARGRIPILAVARYLRRLEASHG